MESMKRSKGVMHDKKICGEIKKGEKNDVKIVMLRGLVTYPSQKNNKGFN